MATTERSTQATPTAGEDLLKRERVRLIDLSRDIFEGMPLWPGHQRPFVMVNQTIDGFKQRFGTTFGFEAHNWLLSEHTGTHTDAISEYDQTGAGASLDHMPLEYYYGEGVCLDLTSVRHPASITASDLEAAERAGGRAIERGAIVLLYTGHGDRTYPSDEFVNVYTGLDREAAIWLAEKGVVNIGIDSLAIDHSDDLKFSAHAVCGEYQIVNTENLTNLDQLVGRRFIYFGLPLHFREGTGSPIRAAAWLYE